MVFIIIIIIIIILLARPRPGSPMAKDGASGKRDKRDKKKHESDQGLVPSNVREMQAQIEIRQASVKVYYIYTFFLY